VSESRVVVHLTVERFRRACRGRGLEDMMSLTEEVGRLLDQHGSGWTRPSADEAVLVSTLAGAPWARRRSPMDWAGSLRDEIAKELHLDASVGIASTLVAARICSRMARPRGILLWMPGQERQLLEGLPLEDLDELRPAQLARLRSRGIRTLDEMACLGTEDARALLGVEGQRLLALVRGEDRFLDVERNGRLARAVDLLARRLAKRLGSSRRRARGLELQVLYEDGVVRETYVLLSRATAAVDELLEAGLRLAEMTPKRQDHLAGLALTATGLTAENDELHQLGLFGLGRPREIVVRLGRSPGAVPERRSLDRSVTMG
jgi:nucleotidyltransferase/DNA polymerase involved in DNA repair